MPDDVARYAAARFRALYPLSCPATCAEIDAALQARGIRIVPTESVTAFVFRRGRPVVFLRPDSPPPERAHEAFHAWLLENVANGIDYGPGEWAQCSEEEAADRFASELCG